MDWILASDIVKSIYNLMFIFTPLPSMHRLLFHSPIGPPRLMVLSGTSLNCLVGLGSIILLLGVIIAAIPLTEETGDSIMCNVSISYNGVDTHIKCIKFVFKRVAPLMHPAIQTNKIYIWLERIGFMLPHVAGQDGIAQMSTCTMHERLNELTLIHLHSNAILYMIDYYAFIVSVPDPL